MWFTVKLPEEIKKDNNYDYSKENRDLIAEHGLNAIKEIKKAIKSIKDKKGSSFINYYMIGDAITSNKINHFDKKSFNLKRYTLSEKDDKWSQFPDDVVRDIGKSFGVGPYATMPKSNDHRFKKLTVVPPKVSDKVKSRIRQAEDAKADIAYKPRRI